MSKKQQPKDEDETLGDDALDIIKQYQARRNKVFNKYDSNKTKETPEQKRIRILKSYNKNRGLDADKETVDTEYDVEEKLRAEEKGYNVEEKVIEETNEYEDLEDYTGDVCREWKTTMDIPKKKKKNKVVIKTGRNATKKGPAKKTNRLMYLTDGQNANAFDAPPSKPVANEPKVSKPVAQKKKNKVVIKKR